MANRIKGITVEIGGDVTGLDKALQGVNKNIKDTQSQLKDVERLLKLDPSNTELLTQKQKLLKDAVGNTKEKLEALKTAQEQAKKQLANGDLGQDKYDALQREIIETEKKLEDLEEQAKRSNVALQKIGEAGKSIKEVGDKISNVGEGMSKYVTAPIAAIGAASMAAFGEVDSAIDSMITKTGAAGESLEQMETAVQNIATSIPTDFQTAADAVGEVSIRFDDVGDNLEILSKYFVEFAAIANTDVVTAVDNVQSSMAAFGLKTNNAYFVLDMLTAAAQETGTDVNQLTSMITQNAGAMKEMGFSYQDTAFFLANLNKNGVDASSVMTGLKKAWQTASKDGKSMQDVLGELSTKIISASSDTEAYQAAIEIFGAKAGPAIAQAMRDGRLSLDEFGYSLQEFDDIMATTFYDTLDPIDQTTLMMNELKLVGAELAGTIQEMLVPILETLREKVHALREWWSGLSEEQQQSIVKIAGIVAAIGPLLVVIGKVVSFIGTIMSLAPALGGVIAALSGPIGIAIAVIAALVAGGVLLYKNWDTIKEKATALGKHIKEKWENIKTSTTETWNKVKDHVSETTDNLKSMVSQKLSNIKQSFEENGGGIKGVVAATWTAIKEKWTLGFDVINTLTGGKLDGIKQKISDKFTAIKDIIKEKIEAAKDAVHNAIERIKEMFDFNFEIPHIPLPHFSVQPPGWELGDLLKGSIPSLGIEWYRKAMSNGMILNSPTIFGMQDGHLLAGGEAGSETVVGTSALMKMIGQAVDSAGKSIEITNNVYVNGYGFDVDELAQKVGEVIGTTTVQKLRMSGSW